MQQLEVVKALKEKDDTFKAYSGIVILFLLLTNIIMIFKNF